MENSKITDCEGIYMRVSTNTFQETPRRILKSVLILYHNMIMTFRKIILDNSMVRNVKLRNNMFVKMHTVYLREKVQENL